MQPDGLAATCEVLADVLRQVAGREPRLTERARADRQIAEQLDVDEPATPCAADVALGDPAADREVRVQPVPARVPLAAPTGTGTARRPLRELAEELGQVGPQRRRIVVARPGVGQRAKPVQAVGGAVPAELPSGPARRVSRASLGVVSEGFAPATDRSCGAERPAALGGFG